MNDFLDKIFFDNTVKQYLIIAVIIVFVLLAKKYIAHYVARFIFSIIKLKWKSIDSATFQKLAAKPLALFLGVFVMVATLDNLSFPKALNFSIYHISLHGLLQSIATASIIITFFMFLIKCIDFIGIMIKERYAHDEHRSRSQIIFFFKDFIKVVLWMIAVLLILKHCFHYDLAGFLTGLGIMSAGIAFALKENFENVIASIVIFFDKPFTTGDVVKVGNISGTIEKIGLRSTRIRSDDKTYITVPNKQMSDTILDNLSNRLQRRYVLKLEIVPSTSHQKVQQLVTGLQTIIQKNDIQNASVFVTDITSAAIIISVEIYTAPVAMAAFNGIKQTVNMQVLELLEKLNIEIAGRSSAVTVTMQEPPSPTKIL
jgi:MscS family membrane protein